MIIGLLSNLINNCHGERSFCNTTRVNNRLRSSMLEERLAALNLLGVYVFLLYIVHYMYCLIWAPA